MTLYKIITYPFYYHKFFKIFILPWRIVPVMWPQFWRNVTGNFGNKKFITQAKQPSIQEMAQVANYKQD
jgi:hypothetical protein